MQETLNYIKVLNWGYGGFCGSFENIAPLSLSQDFDSSLEQIEKRLAVVDRLNYNTLFAEATSANGKANLEKYRSVEDSIEYSLHFVRDRNKLLQMIPTMYKPFMEKLAEYKPSKDKNGKYRDDGIWTIEQYAQYKGALSALERGFELRLKEFCTAYDYKLGDDQDEQQPKPQQKDLHYYCNKAIEKGYLVKTDGGYRRTKEWTKAQLAYFLKHFLNADGTFPDKKYCLMFGENRLSKAADQLSINKNGDGKPRGYEIVDELLQE